MSVDTLASRISRCEDEIKGLRGRMHELAGVVATREELLSTRDHFDARIGAVNEATRKIENTVHDLKGWLRGLGVVVVILIPPLSYACAKLFDRIFR